MAGLKHGGAAVTLVLAACLAQFVLAAQDRQVPQAPTFRTRVTLVPLDVRVLDRSGQPIADLGKDDFTISEDGVAQQVSHCERQVLTARPADAAAPLVLRPTGALELRPQDRRVFLIVLRPTTWLPSAPFGLVEAITRFLRDRLLPQDYAALWAWDRVTDVTTDHEAVAQVVERLRAYQASIDRAPDARTQRLAFGLNGLSGRALPPEIQAGLDAAFEPSTSSVRLAPRVTSKEISALLEQVTRNAMNSSAARGDDDLGVAQGYGARNQVLTLFSAIQYLRYIEGEKHLVYFSSGGLWLPTAQDEKSIGGIASDGRVVLHVIQSGLSTARSEFSNLKMSMAGDVLAEQTGGQSFINQEPDRALARIDQATRIGYLLGYYPSNAGLDGRYRKVMVTVKRPPGATVLFRHNYQATDEPAPTDKRLFVIQDRIMTAGAYEQAIRDIPLALTASAKKGVIAAEVRIDLSRIELEQADDRHIGKVEVAFFCTDSNERLIGQAWQTVDLKLKEETYQRLFAEGLRHTADIPVKGTARYVKVVVYDYRADRLGSAVVRLP